MLDVLCSSANVSPSLSMRFVVKKCTFKWLCVCVCVRCVLAGTWAFFPLFNSLMTFGADMVMLKKELAVSS